MTPFIIWLSKSEVEEMLSTLGNIKNRSTLAHNVLNSDGLLTLAQNLLIQNNSLMNIIQKIEPFSPMYKSSVDIFNRNEKCDHFKNKLKDMQKHCLSFNTKLEYKFEEISQLICTDCPVKNELSCSNN